MESFSSVWSVLRPPDANALLDRVEQPDAHAGPIAERRRTGHGVHRLRGLEHQIHANDGDHRTFDSF